MKRNHVRLIVVLMIVILEVSMMAGVVEAWPPAWYTEARDYAADRADRVRRAAGALISGEGTDAALDQIRTSAADAAAARAAERADFVERNPDMRDPAIDPPAPAAPAETPPAPAARPRSTTPPDVERVEEALAEGATSFVERMGPEPEGAAGEVLSGGGATPDASPEALLAGEDGWSAGDTPPTDAGGVGEWTGWVGGSGTGGGETPAPAEGGDTPPTGAEAVRDWIGGWTGVAAASDIHDEEDAARARAAGGEGVAGETPAPAGGATPEPGTAGAGWGEMPEGAEYGRPDDDMVFTVDEARGEESGDMVFTVSEVRREGGDERGATTEGGDKAAKSPPWGKTRDNTLLAKGLTKEERAQLVYDQVAASGGWFNYLTGGPLTSSFTAIENAFGEPYEGEDPGKLFQINTWAEGICERKLPRAGGARGFLTSASGKTYAHVEAEKIEIDPCFGMVSDADNLGCIKYYGYRISGEIVAAEFEMKINIGLSGDGVETYELYVLPVTLEIGDTLTMSGANMLYWEMYDEYDKICIIFHNADDIQDAMGRVAFNADDDNPMCTYITEAEERYYQEYEDMIDSPELDVPELLAPTSSTLTTADIEAGYVARPGLTPTTGTEDDTAGASTALGDESPTGTETTDTGTEPSEETPEPATDVVEEEDVETPPE